MLTHTLEVLEFEKIKNKLRQYIFSGLGKTAIYNINFSKNKKEIQKALREVSELSFLLQNTNLPPLGIHDIRKELKRAKLENSYLEPEGLVKTESTLRAVRMLKSYLQLNKELAPSLQTYNDKLYMFKHIEDKISIAIDDNNYQIKDTASKELNRIRSQIITYKNKIEKKLGGLLRDKNFIKAIQENIITLRENRYVIPIKKDYKGKLSGIVLDTSSSGNTLFMEPSVVVEDNNQLMSLLVEEKQEEIRILKKLTALITEKWNEINDNLYTLGQFELVYAKAQMSINTESNEVAVNDEGDFHIIKAKHPLLSGDVVPVNLIVGRDYNMLIITGPNTGGKTVSLKTLGLLTLMTMAGMHIPANKDSKVSVVDNIFTDIGDEQSISQNLSTFSSHIKRITKIIRKATNKSLVLIDEIGAGTDPREGSAIGIAVLEQLLRRMSKTVVTTHFAKIKNFGLRKSKVETASCEFNIKTLSPTYRILYGIPGDSNAITIAKRLGLSWYIVKRANQLYKKGNDKSDNVIKSLSNEKTKYSKLLEIYEQKLKETSDKEEQLRQKESELQQKESELKKGKLREISEFIQESRKEILKLVNEAKTYAKNSKQSKEIGKTMSGIDKLSKEVKNLLADESDKPSIDKTNEETEVDSDIVNKDAEIQIGNKVKIKTLGKVGKVLQKGKKDDFTVQVGGIKFVLSKSDLAKIIEEKSKKQDDDVDITVTASSDVFESPPFELNIIGMRGEEAVKKSEQYIEALHYADRELGRIVHGKGEGILRKLITDMLKNHPYVKSFRSALPNEGGYGVTEVLVKN